MKDTVTKKAKYKGVRKKAVLNPIVIIGGLFFIFGFITWLNSVLIPYLRIACELNNFESYLVAFAFYIAYFVMALPSGWLLKKTGFKNGMAIGLIIMSAGAAIFIPAAVTRQYSVFLLALFVLGSGLALLQTASNPYVTILGPLESAAKRISIMGVCNKFAGALAPVILGAVVLKNADSFSQSLKTMTSAEKVIQLDNLASRVIAPYIIIVAALLLLTLVLFLSGLPEIDTEKEDENTALLNSNKTSVFQFPHLLLGVLTLFLYIGTEVIAGDTIISYGKYHEISLSVAKFFTTYTLIFMIAGYLTGIVLIPKYLSQQRALLYCAVLGVVFSLCALLATGFTSVFFISLLGLANSLMWPALWPLALANLGRYTKTASSMLIMGLAGGALIPLLYGKLADIYTPQQAYWILIPCYAFIFYYALSGHRAGMNNNSRQIPQTQTSL